MTTPKPLATLVLKNRSMNPITLRRSIDGQSHPIDVFGAMGLKIYKAEAFLSIDWENRTVLVDFGSDEE